ncbi:ANTAR domain-containing protein [Allobranchiibius sp. CTAmp26]|uniref:ANTAR domain-containing protein n=1 Tax=Allobranchiibius sp. CTAmp26 TaxID=2815214 RepID=UPI001AA1BD58|nr:ANTAR domain-containing protein [Allobranchiibius sp. CTAmp26]MBO1754885.1 ANTAR domain-containing protein [Allobranchiibius sp. CTAmp26]
MLPDLERQLVAYADAARDLHEVPSGQSHQRSVELATRLVPGCVDAGIQRLHRRAAETLAATSGLCQQADLRARDLARGPGLDAFGADEAVVSADLRAETRWQGWSSYVAEELGFVAVVSVPLRSAEHSFGALTLYFAELIANPDQIVARTEALAIHVVLALACNNTIEHQTVALENRTIIGQAQGVLMTHLGMTPDAAFEYLQRLSQNGNRKLAVVAAEIVNSMGRKDATAGFTDGHMQTPLGGRTTVIHPPAAEGHQG